MFLITLLKKQCIIFNSLIALLVTQNLSVVRLWKERHALRERGKERQRKRQKEEGETKRTSDRKFPARSYEVILKLGGWGVGGIELWLVRTRRGCFGLEKNWQSYGWIDQLWQEMWRDSKDETGQDKPVHLGLSAFAKISDAN